MGDEAILVFNVYILAIDFVDSDVIPGIHRSISGVDMR